MDRYTFRCSTKPLLVAGHGIRLAKAQDELNKVKIPIVTTFNGFDLVPSNHPNFVGRIGTVGTYGGNYALRNCDLLFCVGTRNNIRQVSYNWKNFAPQARKIIVDIDPAELYKIPFQGERFWMDAKDYLEYLNKQVFDCEDWIKHLKDYNKSHPIKLTSPYKFIYELTKRLPKDIVIVAGNGTACVCLFQAGVVKKGQRIFWNSGCASMGYALPAAIGAAATGKKVVCITGEGSLQMNLQELQTIRHYNLPIKIYVLNNKGYRSIQMTQDRYFKSNYMGCTKEDITFPKISDLRKTFKVDIEEVKLGSYVFEPKGEL